MSKVLKGNHYHFADNGLTHKDYRHLIPYANIHTHPQTAIEACRGNSLLRLLLSVLGLVAAIFLVNQVGSGRVPVILLPFFYIGFYIGTNGILIAAAVIALICIVVAVAAISKKGETCVITQFK